MNEIIAHVANTKIIYKVVKNKNKLEGGSLRRFRRSAKLDGFSAVHMAMRYALVRAGFRTSKAGFGARSLERACLQRRACRQSAEVWGTSRSGW